MAKYKIHVWKVIKILIIFNFEISRYDPPKQKKIGQINKLKANLWNTNKSQNVSQLSSHHYGRKCALPFDSKSVSKAESMFLFVKQIIPLTEIQNTF